MAEAGRPTSKCWRLIRQWEGRGTRSPPRTGRRECPSFRHVGQGGGLVVRGESVSDVGDVVVAVQDEGLVLDWTERPIEAGKGLDSVDSAEPFVDVHGHKFGWVRPEPSSLRAGV